LGYPVRPVAVDHADDVAETRVLAADRAVIIAAAVILVAVVVIAGPLAAPVAAAVPLAW